MAALIHIRGSGSYKVQLTLQAVFVAASSAVLPLEILLQCYTVMAQVLLLAVLVLGIALQSVGGSQNATAPALSPAELAYKKAVELRCVATHWAHTLKYSWHGHCVIAHCPSTRVSTCASFIVPPSTRRRRHLSPDLFVVASKQTTPCGCVVRSRRDATARHLKEATQLLKSAAGVKISTSLPPTQQEGDQQADEQPLAQSSARTIEYVQAAESHPPAVRELAKAYDEGEKNLRPCCRRLPKAVHAPGQQRIRVALASGALLEAGATGGPAVSMRLCRVMMQPGF